MLKKMARNMKKYTFFRCGILWLSMLISILKSQSFLDIEEISRMKYGVIISNNPVLFNEKIGENELIISSKHGQQYICTLPEIQVDLNVEQKNSNFHYSLVTKILDEAFNGSCLTYHKGWWSYNVCHKDKIEQFHVENDAKISSVTLLGFYESEDYSNVSVSESEMLNGPVHNQKYTNGAICDLTSKPRSSVVKYICGENNAILQVDEPESCQYVVTISSIKLCSHPLFKKQEENEHFNMVCSPSLSQDAYNKYIKLKKNKQANSRDLKDKYKEKEAAANKKPDIKNIFQDLKDTATGLGMLFGSFFGELGESMQKIAAPIKSEAEEKQVISTKNVSPIVTENVPSSEGKQDISKREKISTDISEDNQKTELNKLPLEGNTKSNKISPLETDVADKFYTRKGQLSIEYSQLKDSAKDEIQMSKKMLEKMQKKVDESETPAEKLEWEKLVKLLKEDIKKFEDQMSVLDQQMTEIEKVEDETERNLHIVNDEITSERKLKKIASALKSTNKFEKSLIDHTTEKLSNSKLKNAEASESSLSASLKQLDKVYKIFQKGIRDIQMKDTDAKPKDSQDEIIKKNSVNQNSKKLSEHVSSINEKDQNDMSIPNDEINEKKNTDDKMTKHLKTLENDKESNENDENMLEVKFGVQSFDDLANEIDMDDSDENLVDKNAKDIEVAVKKQLQEAGLKINDNIKIKIITSKEKFDKYNANSKLLSTSGSLDFKDLLMGLLGNSKEKETEENRYNALQSNYDTIYDENEAEEENKLEEGDLNEEIV